MEMAYKVWRNNGLVKGYECVKMTEQTIVYRKWGHEFREALTTQNHSWFSFFDTAKAVALTYKKNQIVKLQRQLDAAKADLAAFEARVDVSTEL